MFNLQLTLHWEKKNNLYQFSRERWNSDTLDLVPGSNIRSVLVEFMPIPHLGAHRHTFPKAQH